MISSYFFEDHREIDALFSRLRREVATAMGAGASDEALLAESFRALAERLERHMQWEEEVLFPAVEGKMPELAHGPGRVMRLEHTDIRAHLRTVRHELATAALDETARQAIRGALRTAESVLAEHNEKEETVYYPLCDSLLTSEESAFVVDRLRNAR